MLFSYVHLMIHYMISWFHLWRFFDTFRLVKVLYIIDCRLQAFHPLSRNKMSCSNLKSWHHSEWQTAHFCGWLGGQNRMWSMIAIWYEIDQPRVTLKMSSFATVFVKHLVNQLQKSEQSSFKKNPFRHVAKKNKKRSNIARHFVAAS